MKLQIICTLAQPRSPGSLLNLFRPLTADTFIQKTKKLYLDTRTQRNILKLNQDIAEVEALRSSPFEDLNP